MFSQSVPSSLSTRRTSRKIATMCLTYNSMVGSRPSWPRHAPHLRQKEPCPVADFDCSAVCVPTSVEVPNPEWPLFVACISSPHSCSHPSFASQITVRESSLPEPWHLGQLGSGFFRRTARDADAPLG